MPPGIRGPQAEQRYMQRKYEPKTKVALTANTETYLTVSGGTRFLTIDSDVNLKIAWSDTTTSIGIDVNYPTKVLANIPTEIIVPTDQIDNYQTTLYCHVFNATDSGDIRWAEE